MKVHDLFARGTPFFKGVVVGKPLKLRNMFSPADLEDSLKSKPTRQTVFIKNTATGQVVGKRSIWQA